MADAWLTDGQDAHHVRMYAPDEAWLDGAIREFIYYRLVLRSGSAAIGLLLGGFFV